MSINPKLLVASGALGLTSLGVLPLAVSAAEPSVADSVEYAEVAELFEQFDVELTAFRTIEVSGGLPAHIVAQPELQAGWDRDHFWLKFTRAEVVSGAVKFLCQRYVPWPGSMLCGTIANIAGRIIGGSGGVWVEIFPRSLTIRYGTF
jgi:hypothetical protein